MTRISFSILWLAACAAMVLSFGCGEDDDQTPSNIYEQCCSTGPVLMDFNPGRVYIANIFTPNFDGINDAFVVQTDDDIQTIIDMTITDEDGVVLYTVNNQPPNDPSIAWLPNQNNETAYRGFFNYTLEVLNINNDTFMLTGSGCAFVCDDANPFEDFMDCTFPLQHDGLGGFDLNLDNGESPCN